MLTSRQELAAFRADCKAALSAQKIRILVCAGTGCVAGGSLDVYQRLIDLCNENKLSVSVELEEHVDHDSIGIKKSGCHGFCEMGPLVKIEPMGWLYLKVKTGDCEEIVEKTVMHGEPVERLFYTQSGRTYEKQFDIPFYERQTRVVLGQCGQIDADSIREYIAEGGYTALEKALFDMTGEQICSDIEESGLRGRGGGGYPTGRKWGQVRRQKEEVRYIVCNGDEGDPGAFMDRSIMEGNPHRMLEGMIIAGVATGAHDGYIYVRAEYPLAVKRLKNAIEQAEACGILGENILGTGFAFQHAHKSGCGSIRVRRGKRAYGIYRRRQRNAAREAAAHRRGGLVRQADRAQ